MSLKVGLNTAFEPGAGTPAHSGEYLLDGGHQAGLDTLGNVCLSNSPLDISIKLRPLWTL